MNYEKILSNSFQGKKITGATVAIIAGVAVGTAIGALFATERGRILKSKFVSLTGDFFNQLRGKSASQTKQKLSNLIGDVRSHIKQNADGLLGLEKKRHNPSEIHVANAGTTSWKNPVESHPQPDVSRSKISLN